MVDACSLSLLSHITFQNLFLNHNLIDLLSDEIYAVSQFALLSLALRQIFLLVHLGDSQLSGSAHGIELLGEPCFLLCFDLRDLLLEVIVDSPTDVVSSYLGISLSLEFHHLLHQDVMSAML